MKKIEYYHKNSDVIAYEKTTIENGYWEERTYDENGNELTYKDSYDYWEGRTYDENGNELTFKNSYDYWEERTYDENGNELTFKNSYGYWYEKTYDENGNELTFKESNSDCRIRGGKVIKEESEAFTNPLVNKITE